MLCCGFDVNVNPEILCRPLQQTFFAGLLRQLSQK